MDVHPESSQSTQPVIRTLATMIQNKTNPKKRKLDEIHTKQPCTKKRKLNSNNFCDKVNKIIERNQTLQKQSKKLTKERNHYKNGYNIYKKETNKWKSKYNELCSNICALAHINTKPLKPENVVKIPNIINTNNVQMIDIRKDKDNNNYNTYDNNCDENCDGNIVSESDHCDDNNYKHMTSLKLQSMKYPKLTLPTCINDFDENVDNFGSLNDCCKTKMLVPFKIARKVGEYVFTGVINNYVQCNKCNKIYSVL
eukprot:473052_1